MQFSLRALSSYIQPYIIYIIAFILLSVTAFIICRILRNPFSYPQYHIYLKSASADPHIPTLLTEYFTRYGFGHIRKHERCVRHWTSYCTDRIKHSLFKARRQKQYDSIVHKKGYTIYINGRPVISHSYDWLLKRYGTYKGTIDPHAIPVQPARPKRTAHSFAVPAGSAGFNIPSPAFTLYQPHQPYRPYMPRYFYSSDGASLVSAGDTIMYGSTPGGQGNTMLSAPGGVTYDRDGHILTKAGNAVSYITGYNSHASITHAGNVAYVTGPDGVNRTYQKAGNVVFSPTGSWVSTAGPVSNDDLDKMILQDMHKKGFK